MENIKSHYYSRDLHVVLAKKKKEEGDIKKKNKEADAGKRKKNTNAKKNKD